MEEKRLSVAPGLLAGAVAGVASKGATYPFDTVKALLQVQGSVAGTGRRQLHTWSACRLLAKEEGMKGFYRGFSLVAVGTIPANIAYYGGYELAKRYLEPDGTFWRDAAVGAAAQLLAGVVYTPIDIIKERLQVQSIMTASYTYKAPLDALQAMWAKQGFFGLFKGYWATNAVWLPWNTVYIAAYEHSKRSAVDILQLPEASGLPLWVLTACSMSSATLAVAATHPLDVVKTRLQVLSASDRSLTALRVAQELVRYEGPQAFVSGLLARVLNIAPGCALSWMIYERLKPKLEASEYFK